MMVMGISSFWSVSVTAGIRRLMLVTWPMNGVRLSRINIATPPSMYFVPVLVCRMVVLFFAAAITRYWLAKKYELDFYVSGFSGSGYAYFVSE